MMQDKQFDYSDITCSSSAPSSSSASPKRSLLYYVDSPSSRSEATTSPLYSPPPPAPPPPATPPSPSSYRPSSAATTSRLSASSSSSSPVGRSRFTRPRPYNCYAIREEAPVDEDDHHNHDHHHHHRNANGYDNTYYNHPNNLSSYSRPCQFTLAISGFFALFGFFCLILWGAAKPFKPNITVKSLTTHNMNLGVGVDHTGVPTRMLTLNCSVDIAVHNPATFFGIHLRSKSLQLMYSRITIATGQISKYYQARKSRGMLKVKVEGHEVALYGVGESLAKSSHLDRIPVRLVFHLFSTGKVVGKLVTVGHKSHISCSLFITKSHSSNNKPINLQHNACVYL